MKKKKPKKQNKKINIPFRDSIDVIMSYFSSPFPENLKTDFKLSYHGTFVLIIMYFFTGFPWPT